MINLTQTPQTHAENDVSLTQTNVLGLTQTTQTYTELAALLRSQLSALPSVFLRTSFL